MITHTLKVEQPYFQALVDGTKTFEVRRNDRGFQCGDTLRLIEWSAATDARPAQCTGATETRTVSYVYSGDPRWPALMPGYVVLGLAAA